MRKSLELAMLAMLAAVSIQAKHITSSEALQLAFSKAGNSAAKALGTLQTYQLTYSSEGLYAFNKTTAGGFVILAADDCVSDVVLGYSDSGTFDFASMPEAMKEWLDQMNDEVTQMVALLSQNPNRVSSSLDVLDPIEPLTKSQWNQDSPYNNMAPTLASDSTSHYNAGCVPVAMGQVMYFHKWPKQGKGSRSYSWDIDGTMHKLSMDFSQSTYDWENMCNSYSNTNSDVQKNAVAKLLLDCGVSVCAEYRSSATEANSVSVVYALTDYFDYDKSMSFIQRNYYSKKEWRDLLYNDLSNGLPIYYRGTSNDGGHAFVCDGYKDGLFHINWGWGGMSNGYFQIALLEPAEQGIGGSTSGYQCNQKALIGIKPNASGTLSRLMYCTGDFTISPLTNTANSTLTFSGSYENESCIATTFTLGIKIVDVQGNVQYVKSSNLVDKRVERGGVLTNMNIPISDAKLSEGTYIITPAYYDADKDEWSEMHVLKTSSKQCIIAAVDAEGNITFSYPSSSATIVTTTLTPKKRIIVGYDTDVDFTISCTEGEYLNNVTVAFLESGTTNIVKESSNIFIDLGKGEDYSYTTSVTPPASAGTYDLVVLNTNGDIVSDRMQVTVEEAPSDSLAYKGTLKATTKAANNQLFTLNFQCTSGVFNSKITVFLYTRDLELVGSIPSASRTFLVQGDDAQSITFAGTFDLTEGTWYVAKAYFPNPSWEQIASRSFKATAATGIEEINANDDEILPAYNIQGQKVDKNTRGIIIRNGRKYLNR